MIKQKQLVDPINKKTVNHYSSQASRSVIKLKIFFVIPADAWIHKVNVAADNYEKASLRAPPS